MAHKTIEVEIDARQINAYVTVNLGCADQNDPVTAEAPTVEQILTELQSQGVIFGLRRDFIETLVGQKRWGEKVLVAIGVHPLPGENGRVEYSFPMSSRPVFQETDDGNVNLRDIGLIHVVNENDVLARIILPQKGIPGTTVLGHEIPAPLGGEAFLKAGKNTRFSDAQQQELRAEVTGSVSFSHGMVNVEKTYLVTGDVDFSTGNIDFPGDVLIHKDVICGFTVKAGGKIEVRGVVEDATLEGGGDVLVKGGFEGNGRGLIRSGGEVHVKFVENQVIEAVGSVHIGQNALNARVSSGGTIYLNGGTGVVRGGHLRARGWIVVKVAGNVNNTPTVLEIYQDGTVHAELEKRELEVTLQQLDWARTRLALSLLLKKRVTDKAERKQIEQEKIKLSERLESIRTTLGTAIPQLKEFKASSPEARSTGRVQVLQKAYPGVKIIIGNLKYVLNDEHHRAYFKKCGLEIAVLSPEEAAHEEVNW